jgi:hypothetical protein
MENKNGNVYIERLIPPSRLTRRQTLLDLVRFIGVRILEYQRVEVSVASDLEFRLARALDGFFHAGGCENQRQEVLARRFTTSLFAEEPTDRDQATKASSKIRAIQAEK